MTHLPPDFTITVTLHSQVLQHLQECMSHVTLTPEHTSSPAAAAASIPSTNQDAAATHSGAVPAVLLLHRPPAWDAGGHHDAAAAAAGGEHGAGTAGRRDVSVAAAAARLLLGLRGSSAERIISTPEVRFLTASACVCVHISRGFDSCIIEFSLRVVLN